MGEQFSGPDETQFNQMQVVAEAAGPAAEARRLEMQRWSDATGAYAEEAAIVNQSEEERLVNAGNSPEDVASQLAAKNKQLASNGVFVSARRHGTHSTDIGQHRGQSTMVGPRPDGKIVTGGIDGQGIVTVDRSPAHMRNN